MSTVSERERERERSKRDEFRGGFVDETLQRCRVSAGNCRLFSSPRGTEKVAEKGKNANWAQHWLHGKPLPGGFLHMSTFVKVPLKLLKLTSIVCLKRPQDSFALN